LLSPRLAGSFASARHSCASDRPPQAVSTVYGRIGERRLDDPVDEPRTRRPCGFRLNLTEGEGFEPSIRLTTDNGFRDRRIRPLCHPSEAEKEGFEPSMETFIPITP